MMKKRDQDNFWFWLRQLRMRTIFLITIPCLILIPLIVLWLMPIVGVNNSKDTIDSADTARRVLGLIDFDHLSGPEIKRRIEELLRIKDSVRTELRLLEQRRAGMLGEIQSLSSKIEKLRMEESKESKELERLKVSIEQVKIQQKEFIQRNTPDISPPLPLLASRPQPKTSGLLSHEECSSMEQCWDYSRCSVSSRLPVYSYSSQFSSPYINNNPDQACLHVILDPESTDSLHDLDFWAGDGRNHLVIKTEEPADKEYFSSKAIIVNSVAHRNVFRPGYDIVIPPLNSEHYSWDKLQLLVPVMREYLLGFEGHRDLTSLENSDPEVGRQERRLVAVLQDMKLKGTTDKFMLSFSCTNVDNTIAPVDGTEWSLCGDQEDRIQRMSRSTFCLVLPPPSSTGLLSSLLIQSRIQECLLAASVPVILSTDIILPFDEV